MSNASFSLDRLFYAVKLPDDAGTKTTRLCRQLCMQHGLNGSEVSADRLHITLHWLGDHAGLPPELVSRALAAGELVNTPPFDVAMNRVHSYSDGGLALSGSGKGVTALRRFQKDLGAAMDDVGIGHLKRDAFRPHVTLLYGNEPIASADTSPIWWTVREFVLIHSIQGKSRHVVLGNWQLHEKQMRLEGF